MNEQVQWNTIEAQLIAKAWKDEAFKQALLREPKAVLERELGAALPAGLRVEVLAPPANTICLVLPPPPLEAAGELSDEELEAVSAGVTKVSSMCVGQ
jgi:hypothetical protein